MGSKVGCKQPWYDELKRQREQAVRAAQDMARLRRYREYKQLEDWLETPWQYAASCKTCESPKPHAQCWATLADSPAWKDYERRWSSFESDGSAMLSSAAMPRPPKDLGRLLQHLDHKEARSVLRSELIRWHPDKFLQKFSHRLVKEEIQNVMQQVNSHSQQTHQYWRKLEAGNGVD